MFMNIVQKINQSVCSKFRIRHFSHNLNKFRIMKIGTHNGIFHCDEVLACFMLKSLPEYKDAKIVRTRDLETLKQCDIVVDVGNVFDHQKKLYDHHQRDFNESLSTLRPELGEKYKIRLSSAGLIYAFYGERVLKELSQKNPLSSDNLRKVYKKVYENLIEELDAIDNGIPISDEEPKYRIRTHLSARVNRLNPEWNSENNSNVDELFQKAIDLVSEEFLYTVNYLTSIWLPAREHLISSFKERFEVHDSGKILKFNISFPWKEHLFDLEDELSLQNEIKYVLFQSQDNWRVQAVPDAPASFILRKPLNKKWWGRRDEELSAVSEITDCVFCHSTGFIGGNKTLDGALKMAIESLNASDEESEETKSKIIKLDK